MRPSRLRLSAILKRLGGGMEKGPRSKQPVFLVDEGLKYPRGRRNSLPFSVLPILSVKVDEQQGILYFFPNRFLNDLVEIFPQP